MNTFCKALGFYAPNTRFKPTSSYLIQEQNKLLVLDAGVGIKSKFIEYVVCNNILPENITIVISHNHIDHVAGLFSIGDFMIENFPNRKIKVYMSDTSEKFYDWYGKVLNKYSSVFEVSVLDENSKFYFCDMFVEFCKTNHCEDKIKSYATKISSNYSSFVYTSDIASVDNTLRKFISNADVVMVDGGNPVKRIKTLSGYHGITKENVYNILECSVRNVCLTHIKGCFSTQDYIDSLYPDTKEFVSVAQSKVEFDIFTGEENKKYAHILTSLA